MHDDTKSNDPRRFRRLGARAGTWLEASRNPDGSGTDIGLGIIDLSAVGARLVLSESLPVGHALRVGLNDPNGPLYSEVAVVAWSEATDEGTFLTGVVFQKPVARTTLATLGR